MSDDQSTTYSIKFDGIQDAPRLFEQAAAAVKKLDEALQSLQKHQQSLNAQYSAASPQQQAGIEKQIQKISQAVEQIVQERAQAQNEAVTAHADVQRQRTSAPLAASLPGITPEPRPAPELPPIPAAPAPKKKASSGRAAAPPSASAPSPGEPTPPEAPPPASEPPPAMPTPPSLWQQIQSKAGGFGGKMKKNLLEGGGINLGFSLMFGAQQVAGAFTPALSGERVTTEAQQRAEAGLLPTAGGIVGTAVGGFGGQMIGSGIGQIAETLFDAKSEREEKIRLAGEDISSALGRGAAAGKAFSAVIEDSAKRLGTPVVELANSLTQISHTVGGLNIAGASSLQAYLQSQLGDQYAATVPAQIKATTVPFSQNYRDMLAGRIPGSGAAYNDMADYFAATGDRATADQLRTVGGALGTAPTIAQLNAKINAAREQDKNNATRNTLGAVAVRLMPGGGLIPNVDFSNKKEIAAWTAQRDALQKQANDATAASPAKAAGDALADALQNARDQAASGQSGAASYAAYAQQALQRGLGAAGLRQYAGGETDALTYSQQGLIEQQ